MNLTVEKDHISAVLQRYGFRAWLLLQHSVCILARTGSFLNVRLYCANSGSLIHHNREDCQEPCDFRVRGAVLTVRFGSNACFIFS